MCQVPHDILLRVTPLIRLLTCNTLFVFMLSCLLVLTHNFHTWPLVIRRLFLAVLTALQLFLQMFLQQFSQLLLRMFLQTLTSEHANVPADVPADVPANMFAKTPANALSKAPADAPKTPTKARLVHILSANSSSYVRPAPKPFDSHASHPSATTALVCRQGFNLARGCCY